MPSLWHTIQQQAHAHQNRGAWALARECYAQALALEPANPYTQLALAQLTMMETQFRDGRDGYEARFGTRDSQEFPEWRMLPIPRWQGEPLAGKRLYLWAENGFGDVIMFAAFLPQLLAQRPAGVTLGMYPKMLSLFARAFPSVHVETLFDGYKHAFSQGMLELYPLLASGVVPGQEEALAALKEPYEYAQIHGICDYAAPMGDLLVYGMPGIVPAKQTAPYLTADPTLLAGLRTQFAAEPPARRIGISWYSNNAFDGDIRTIPLPLWEKLLKTPGCRFYSLQHFVAAEEIAQFNRATGCNLIAPDFNPGSDTEQLTALTSAMDEIITIDNSNAHLAGALGVPTTLLLPKGHNFRWPELRGEPSNLWYPHLRIARQQAVGDWAPVMARITETLAQANR